MSSVFKPLESFVQHAVAPITKAVTRAITPPGVSSPPQANITMPAMPKPAPPAKLPSQKPAERFGLQRSFLGGAAQAAQSGVNTGWTGRGNAPGKTLVGQ